MNQALKLFKKDPVKVFDKINSEVVFTDTEQKIIHANKMFLSKFNTDLKTILNRPCSEVMQSTNDQCLICINNKEVNCEVVNNQSHYSMLISSSKISKDYMIKIIQDITKILKSMDNLSKKVEELRLIVESSIGERDLLPICAKCNKIRLIDGSWISPRDFDRVKLKNGLTHGLCPICADKTMEELLGYRDYKKSKQ